MSATASAGPPTSAPAAWSNASNYNYDEGTSTNGKVKLTNKSQQSGLKVLIKLMTLRRLFQADDELDKSKE